MNSPVRRPAETSPAVALYKTILRDALDRRPSGMRKRLAEALGKNRSFVSQIANPAYATPIPAAHIEAILEICHFSPAERDAFLSAYAAAHPHRPHRRPDTARQDHRHRTLALRLPDLGDERRNRELDRLVHDLVARIVRLVEPPDRSPDGRSPREEKP
jgi:hypothetical protein